MFHTRAGRTSDLHASSRRCCTCEDVFIPPEGRVYSSRLVRSFVRFPAYFMRPVTYFLWWKLITSYWNYDIFVMSIFSVLLLPNMPFTHTTGSRAVNGSGFGYICRTLTRIRPGCLYFTIFIARFLLTHTIDTFECGGNIPHIHYAGLHSHSSLSLFRHSYYFSNNTIQIVLVSLKVDTVSRGNFTFTYHIR